MHHSSSVLFALRVWDQADGKQLCSLHGHKGRGVWRCLLHPNQDLLITAGADSSIKLWRLADWMPTHHPLAARASDAFALPQLPTLGMVSATAAAAAGKDDAMSSSDAGKAAPTAPTAAVAASPTAGLEASTEGAAAQSSSRPPSATVRTAGAVVSEATASSRTPATKHKLAASGSGRDSKDEWVRCMKLADQGTLYLATNQGCLYIMQLPSDSTKSSSEWRLLYCSPRKAAITCLQIVPQEDKSTEEAAHATRAQGQSIGGAMASDADSHDHWVVFGDIKGFATCLRVRQSAVASTRQAGSPMSDNRTAMQSNQQLPSLLAAQSKPTQTASDSVCLPRAESGSPQHFQLGGQASDNRTDARDCISWNAHRGKPVLAVFSAPGFGSGHIFTTSVTGTPLHWWLMPHHSSTSPLSAGQVAAAYEPELLAEVRPPLGRGSQIVALDACPKRGLLICGDMAGNVLGFAVPPEIWQGEATDC